MRNIICIILLFTTLSSCAPLLKNLHRFQSDNRFQVTEDQNFIGNKAATQWWYFDFFMDDGSVLVVLFAPYHWWTDGEEEEHPQSLIYVSYLNADGELIKVEKVIDSDEVIYDENSLTCSLFEIEKSHGDEAREYTINFFMDEIRGSASIVSDAKAFSPLPRGSFGSFGSRHLLKQKGDDVSYRYAAHVPQGIANCTLETCDGLYNLTGRAYHEQGWFTGQAEQMGDGWTWYHFVSDRINLFGAKTFYYLELDGEVIVGGLNFAKNRCIFSNKKYAKKHPEFMLGGTLTRAAPNPSFDITPVGEKSTPVICIPAEDTDQLWGTVLQPSRIQFNHKGLEIDEEGYMLIETCKMR